MVAKRFFFYGYSGVVNLSDYPIMWKASPNLVKCSCFLKLINLIFLHLHNLNVCKEFDNMSMNNFSFEESIEKWENRIKETNNLTKSDIEELRTHLEDDFCTLKEMNLCEEEAFLVAINRLGEEQDWSQEYAECNVKILKLKYFANICSGVLVYISLYYMAVIIVGFIYVLCIKTDSRLIDATLICKRIIYSLLIIIGFIPIIISLSNNRFIVSIFENFNIGSGSLLKIAIITMILGVLNQILIPRIVHFTKLAGGSNVLQYYFLLREFEYLYLIETSITFIILYIKVIRKNDLIIIKHKYNR